ncbi:MAG: hypothetical protein AAFR17_16555 [Pseudomonadota bacterium]
MTSVTEGLTPRPLSRAKERDYRVIFYCSFPLFLAVALVMRLLPWDGAGRRPGVLSEARSMANTIIPFAFMH